MPDPDYTDVPRQPSVRRKNNNGNPWMPYVLMVLAGTGGGVGGSVWGNSNTFQIASNKAAIAKIEKVADDAKLEIARRGSVITSNTGRVDKLEEAVSEIKGDMSTIKSDIGWIRRKLESVRSVSP